MKYWKIVRLLLPLFFTMGCDDKNDSVREEQQTLIIASVLPAQKESLVLVGGSSGEGVWNPLYICKNEDSADWRIWHTDFRIRGFDEIYEEGYEYRIRIRIRYWRGLRQIKHVFVLRKSRIRSGFFCLQTRFVSPGLPKWQKKGAGTPFVLLARRRTMQITTIKL